MLVQTMLRPGQRYRVGQMVTNASVHYALDHRLARDPEYVKEVIRSYINCKEAHGRTKQEIDWKLEILELELPGYMQQFAEVRQERGFRRSRVSSGGLVPGNYPNGSMRLPQPALARTSSQQAPRPATTPVRMARAHTTAAPVTRVEDDSELPPPPYAANDPEPDSTRILQERLAAEAEASGRISGESSRPAAPASPAVTGRRSSERMRRTSSVSQPSPPPAAEDNVTRQVIEESELSEAQRMSLQAERERIELEEAIRRSLSEAPPERLAAVSEEPDVHSAPSSSRSAAGPGPTSPPALPERKPTSANGMTGAFADLAILQPDIAQSSSSRPPMQSKNPFLSPQDPATRESPGSSRTAYSADHAEPTYDPPPGPPPGVSEDPLATLRSFDTVFLVDDGSTMTGERWEQAKTALMDVAEVAAKYLSRGVDVYFVNSKRVGKELHDSQDVEEIFGGLKPRGQASTAARLSTILQDYMNRLERFGTERPMSLVVITDGHFAQQAETQQAIISCAQRLDHGSYPPAQLGVQFLQIGDDVDSRETLQHLDDSLSATHGVRDMVDTVPFTGEAMSSDLIIKTLLGGINRRLDA